MKRFLPILLLLAAPALAQEPDGLILPKGFHASVVAEGLGPLRHLAVRANGDLYASTGSEDAAAPLGLLAIRLGPDHKPARVEHFSSVNGGTGIRFHDGLLYAASDTAVYRFAFAGDELVPSAAPQTVMDGMPAGGNRPLAFDDKGGLYVGVDSVSNVCIDEKSDSLVGPMPCPELKDRSGIWKFDADKTGQPYAAGEKFTTGSRDITGMDWGSDGALYAAMHGRDGSHHSWPKLISQKDDDNIGDEVHRLVAGSDMGWPYSYYDDARKLRLVAPEYGGDGKKTVPAGRYDTPVLSIFPMRAAPVDVMFYDGAQFPKPYRGGMFLALHGTGGVALPMGRNGYRVAFVPFVKGKAGRMQVFADGFAGPAPINRNSGKSVYRPVGLAVAPDGALYVADSNKGRIWRISYGG
jgi:glucose/arabinose dehydrogenase